MLQRSLPVTVSVADRTRVRTKLRVPTWAVSIHHRYGNREAGKATRGLVTRGSRRGNSDQTKRPEKRGENVRLWKSIQAKAGRLERNDEVCTGHLEFL